MSHNPFHSSFCVSDFSDNLPGIFARLLNMVRFSERETCKLVELYREHECLWNPKNVHYRNKQVNQAACAAIARDMNHEDFTVADVKTKLKALRGTYNQELIKIRRSIESGDGSYKPSIKWFGLMEAFIKKLKLLTGDNTSSENADHIPEGIFPDESQWDQQSGSSSEIASVSVSSAPSMPSESEIEQSVRTITEPEIITVTPEIPNARSVSNPDVYTVIPEGQSVQSVSNSQLVTVSPKILTVKAVSNPEVSPATSGTKTTKPASNLEVNTVPSGIQTVQSISQPKYFTLIPEIQTSNSGSNPKYIMLAPELQTAKSVSNPSFVTATSGSNQNARYVAGSQVVTLAPEIQQKGKQASANETAGSRKRRNEEVTSTNSNNDVRQNNNTRSVSDDFSDRNEDEMDAFGHFVALNLRKMSMQSALSAQTEILSVLTRYRLNDSSKQMFPYILTNATSPIQNPVTLQKVFLKS